jgi:hypothetical protein
MQWSRLWSKIPHNKSPFFAFDKWLAGMLFVGHGG